MNSDKTSITENELHQFVDGELSDSRRRVVAECLVSDEALSKKVDTYQEINRKLADAFGIERLQPIQNRLLFIAPSRGRMAIRNIAASLLLMGLGGLLGYSLNKQLSNSDYVRPIAVEAAFAHTVYVPEVLHPVEVDAKQLDHLNAWLSKRLDKPITAPDLRDEGYLLIGGRLLPDEHRAAAQFMYEDTAGERMTIFIRQAANIRETAFLHSENNELGIVYWVDDGLAYALTAAANKTRLSETAKAVYKRLNP